MSVRVTKTLDGLVLSTAQAVEVPIPFGAFGSTPDTAVIVTGIRVVSLGGSDKRTSAAATCSDFDVRIYDREKSSWTSPSELGMAFRIEGANVIYSGTALYIPVINNDNEASIWVWIRMDAGTVGDFDIEIDMIPYDE